MTKANGDAYQIAERWQADTVSRLESRP